MSSKNELSVILHGGAGRLAEEHTHLKLPGMQQALDAAWQVLVSGRSGIEAVAAALRVMEGDQYFNAGYGGYPNVDKIVLLDVGLMKGTGEFVSLVNVRRVKYPSLVALEMFKNHRHLLSIWTYQLECELEARSKEAKQEFGVVTKHKDMIAPFVQELLEKEDGFELVSENASTHGTVGCVVRDINGEVHAGTSTGGTSLKFNGRIGDSPIIGSGVYADNEIGALSTTGHGEAFLRSSMSGFVLGEMRRALKDNPEVFTNNNRLEDLLQKEMEELGRKNPGRSGAIVVVPKQGNPAFAFNSEMVSVAYRTGSPEKIQTSKVMIAKKDGDNLIAPQG